MKVISGIASTAVLSLLLATTAAAYAQEDHRGDKQDHSSGQQNNREQGKPAQQHAQQPQHAQPQPQQRSQNKTTQHAQQQRPQSHRTQQPVQHAQQQRPSHQTQRPQQHAQQKSQSPQNHEQTQHAQQQQRRPVQNAQAQRVQQRSNQRPQRTQQQQRVEASAWQRHRAGNWQSDHRTWQQRGGYRGYRIPDDRFRGYFGPEHGFRIGGLPFLVVGGYPRFQYDGYWISAVDPWPEYWGNDWYDNDDVYITYADNGYYMYNRRYPGVGIAISISR